MVVAPPQLSTAVTPVVAAVGIVLAHETVTAVGHVTVGAMLSNTVIVCAQVDMFPHASVALYLRVIVNLFAQITLPVWSLTNAKVMAPVQLSVALTPAVVCAGTSDAQLTVTGAGQLMLGATLSRTVINWLQVEKFPQ